MTKRQAAAIKELKVDSDSIFLPGDKGNATVLLDKEEYDHKVRELLDETSYQPIKKNPTLKIEQKVTEVLRSPEKNGKLPNDVRKRVQNQQSFTPQLYGLPKIHKASCPLRPIVSSFLYLPPIQISGEYPVTLVGEHSSLCEEVGGLCEENQGITCRE